MTTLAEHRLLPDEPYQDYAAYRRVWQTQAIDKALQLQSQEVLKEVQASGLRGRGGAGFPTGTKWASVAAHTCPTRQIVCNAAEGEPGTFKDRWLLRFNPYAVLEGMLIAAHVVGARDLYIAIKASFVQEGERIEQAIAEMTEAGLFARKRIKLVRGPEEYLFGEERALLEVIEGNEPLPRETHYPPYEKGLFGTPVSPNPAVVNNAETFAHVPSIVRAGAASFRKLGTDDTPGTLLFTVSGDVTRAGVYEREAGILLSDLFYHVAGGPPNGRHFVAALSGVASAPISARRFRTRADFGSLTLLGSGLGSAGFVLIDDATNMMRVAQSVARFLYVESCNQCSACKHGLRTASEAIDAMFEPSRDKLNQAGHDLRRRALYGARRAPQGNRCYLPVQGSLLIPSLLERHRHAFDALRLNPSLPSEPWPIPKLIDYDAEQHRFLLDDQQAKKTPEWLYEEDEEEPVVPSVSVPSGRPADKPLDAEEVELSVRLPREAVAALEERATLAGRSIDELMAEALGVWLKGRASSAGRRPSSDA